jgi:hypothetical protein
MEMRGEGDTALTKTCSAFRRCLKIAHGLPILPTGTSRGARFSSVHGPAEAKTMGCIRALLAVIALGMLIACGGGPGGSGGETDPGPGPRVAGISGTVTFLGNPLSGVTIYAWETNTNQVVQTTTTDANGHYILSNLLAGGDVPAEYQFWAIRTGYGFYPSAPAGATVMRAGMNGQFAGLNTGNPPIVFTVLDWTPAPYTSLSGADFTAYNGATPLVALAATGQTISYAPGDNGTLRTGIAWPATRFTANGDGTVTDHLTGLIWLQNAGCLSPAIWSNAVTAANKLASGQCGLTDGSVAGTWRMPNLNELESLIDVSASNPALTAGNPFVNVSTGIYWTSTAIWAGDFAPVAFAWVIRLSDGSYLDDEVSNAVTSLNAVWAVKGTASGAVKLQATGFNVPYVSGDDGTLQMGVGLPYPRWVDNGNGTVTDILTGLIWLKQADCIQQPWAAAVAAVNNLASGQCGLSDGSLPGQWRMPNRNEMESMADLIQTNESAYFDYTILNLDNTVYQPAIFTNFVESQFYWTSTTNASTGDAWTVFSCDFGVYDWPKDGSGYTLAVR